SHRTQPRFCGARGRVGSPSEWRDSALYDPFTMSSSRFQEWACQTIAVAAAFPKRKRMFCANTVSRGPTTVARDRQRLARNLTVSDDERIARKRLTSSRRVQRTIPVIAYGRTREIEGQSRAQNARAAPLARRKGA